MLLTVGDFRQAHFQ